jgi:hypothetical protein
LVATTGEGERLRRKLESVLPELVGASWRLARHPSAADVYPDYLVMCHGVVRATIPLMETTLARAEEQAAGDPAAAMLAAYLRHHITEEAGEDEWLLQDLEAVGRDRASVLAMPPSPVVASLVGAQYYWVLHFDPVSFLGYLAALEGYPPSDALIEELKTRTGYGEDAFRTILAHGERDPGHRDELFEVLDRLPVSPEQSALLGLSALWSARMLARAISEVTDGV